MYALLRTIILLIRFSIYVDKWSLHLLVVLALGIGWLLREINLVKRPEKLGPNQHIGNNHLLNENPDQAVVAFIEESGVNSDTFDTHLAVGGLMRRKGDLEKAVSGQESGLYQPGLNKEVKPNVQFKGGRDCFLADFLGRAERLSGRLSVERGQALEESLKIL